MNRRISFVSWQRPVPKPRMTRSDKWKERPSVMQYRAFKDQFRIDARNAGLLAGMIVTELYLKIYIPVPVSWSKKKKKMLAGKPHMIKPGPDGDNVLKSVADSLQSEDVSIWKKNIEKYWDDGAGPRLEVVLVADDPHE